MKLFLKILLFWEYFSLLYTQEYDKDFQNNLTVYKNSSLNYLLQNNINLLNSTSEFDQPIELSFVRDKNDLISKNISELKNYSSEQSSEEILTNNLKINNISDHKSTFNTIKKRLLTNPTNLSDDEILKEISRIENITNYDEFDFKDIQNIISRDDENYELSEEDAKNKKEWQQEMTEFEAAEIITFEIKESEDEVI